MQSKISGDLPSLPHGRNRHYLTSIMDRRKIGIVKIPSPPQLRLLFFRPWSQSCSGTPLRIVSTKNSDHHTHYAVIVGCLSLEPTALHRREIQALINQPLAPKNDHILIHVLAELGNDQIPCLAVCEPTEVIRHE